MPVLGKEAEPHLSPEQIAAQEIQGYIEKVEHHTEVKQPQSQPQQPTQQPSNKVPVDMGKVVADQFSHTSKPKITLPIDQGGIQAGMKSDVSNGFKWLAEWCVMMIKKYPGRVFYMTPETNK